MKKIISKIFTLALAAILAAAWFTGCGGPVNDGRVSVKKVMASAYFSDGLCAVREEQGGKWSYINNKGKTVIHAEYDYASRFTGGSAAVRKTADGKTKYFLIDTKGKVISGQFDNMDAIYYGSAFETDKVVYKGTKYTENATDSTVHFTDVKGKEIFKLNQNSVQNNFANILVVSNGETGNEVKYGAVNILSGKQILPIEYDRLYEINSYGKYNTVISVETFIGIQKGTGTERKHGFTALSGKLIVAPKYNNSIGAFHNGVTQGYIDGSTTDFIDTNGKVLFSVATENYTYFGNFDSKGVMTYEYQKEGKTYACAIDKKGAVLVETEKTAYNVTVSHAPESDFIVKTDEDSFTVYGLNGKRIANVKNNETTRFEYVEAYTRFGLAAIGADGMVNVRMYDGKGNNTAVISSHTHENFEISRWFSVPVFNRSDFATVLVKGVDGGYTTNIVDLKGKVIINGGFLINYSYDLPATLYKDFDYIGYYKGDSVDLFGVASYSKLKSGLMDGKGKVIVESKQAGVLVGSPGYDGTSLYLALVFSENSFSGWRYGFIDKNGDFKIEAKYTYASPFINGLAYVSNEDNKYGFINAIGEEVIPCKYNSIAQY